MNESGQPLGRGGAALAALDRIDVSDKDPRVDQIEIIVASDVQNTLCGELGASAVYGPQKGASPRDVKALDAALFRYGEVLQSALGIDVLSILGGGAAGGLGAGLVAFCGAQLRRGIDVVFHVTNFDDHLLSADLVITGEGKIDEQVRFGKALAGVIERAQRAGVPVAAVVGSVDGNRESFVNRQFLADLESLVDANATTEQAMRNASSLISQKTEYLLRRYLSRIK
jgi:glycerate kinase